MNAGERLVGWPFSLLMTGLLAGWVSGRRVGGVPGQVGAGLLVVGVAGWAWRAQLRSSARVRELEIQALRDPLTGGGNRRAFDLDLQQSSDDHAERREGSYLLLLDVDHFKGVNDRYGHPFGDRVLGELERLLCASVRFGDRVYRVGGEEFAVLLSGTDRAGAETVAERVRRAVQTHLGARAGHPDLELSVSGGLVPTTGSAAMVYAEADRLLYAAKRAGRNRVECEANCWGSVASRPG